MTEPDEKGRILVVDDNAGVRRLLVRELDQEFEVIEAGDYADAVKCIAEQSSICAVICDCNLGAGPNGIDLMRHVRQVAPGLPRITVSGNVSEDVGKELVATGVVNAVIAKPWPKGAVRDVINRYVSRVRGPAPHVGLERDASVQVGPAEEAAIILRIAIDGFWITDMQGRFINVNEAYCRLIGYSRDELLEMQIYDVEAVEKPEETALHIQRIKTLGSARFETKHRCKDGRVVDIEVSANYMDINDGRLFTFLRDVTERNQLIEERERLIRELRGSVAKIKTLSGLIPICMYCKKIRDDDGYWTQVERFMKAHSGVDFTHCVCAECFEQHYSVGGDSG